MSIKMMLFGFAAAGIGGMALTGGGFGGGGHDAERLVARPPAEVYAALSAMAPEGVREGADETEGPAMTLEVRKDEGKAVHYALSVDGRTIGSLDFTVIPDKGGSATRLAADVEVDQPALARQFGDPDAKGDYVPAPEAMVNLAVAGMLAEIAADIEAGRPLPTFEADDLASGDARIPSAGERREMREEMQEAAAAPTPPQSLGSTAPSVDPNAEARKYLNGGK